MFKLVCIDVDGTLLNSKHKLTDPVIQAVRAAYAKGVHIVIATGRMVTSAAYFCDLLGLDSGIIASNGSVITQNEEIIRMNTMKQETVKHILDICKDQKESPIIHTLDQMYTANLRVFLLFSFLVWNKLFPVKTKLKITYLPSYKNWLKVLEKHKDEIVRLEIINNNAKRIERIKPLLTKIGPLEIAGSTTYNLEITAPNVSKGTAVEYLADRYGIRREEVLCIGDSENDLTMLQYAGMGVAMGNAPLPIQQKADYVTDTNDNDGVAKAIEKFILNTQDN